MAPENPRSRWDFKALVDRVLTLLQQARELFLGMNLTSTWARFIMMIIMLPVIYFFLLWLVGESPELIEKLFDSVGKGLERLLTDIASIFRIIMERPPTTTKPNIYAKLPGAPGAPILTSLSLLLRRVSPDSIQMVIAFFALPFIWSFLRAVNVFEDAFNTGSLRSAMSYIMLVNIPWVRPRYVVREGSLIQSGRLTRLQLIGGPAKLTVMPDSLAVLENARGEARIVDAEGSPHMVSGFERVYRIIPLQDQDLTLSHKMRTRDGIPVELKNARFKYSVKRGALGTPPFTYDPQAVMSLVYKHWAGKRWEDPQTRQQNALLLVRQELEQFVSRLDTLDLLPYLVTPVQREEYPTERNVIQEFIASFNSQSHVYGLQLSWQAAEEYPYGEWVLPPSLVAEDHADAIRSSLQDRQYHERLDRLIPREFFEDETHRMAESILQHFEVQREKLTREELIRQLIVLYNQHLAN